MPGRKENRGVRLELFTKVPTSTTKEFEREISLWRAVVDQALTDFLILKNYVGLIRLWLDSLDFEEVCAYAHLPPIQVRALFLRRKHDRDKRRKTST